jgi:hypothetical protein
VRPWDVLPALHARDHMTSWPLLTAAETLVIQLSLPPVSLTRDSGVCRATNTVAEPAAGAVAAVTLELTWRTARCGTAALRTPLGRCECDLLGLKYNFNLAARGSRD